MIYILWIAIVKIKKNQMNQQQKKLEREEHLCAHKSFFSFQNRTKVKVQQPR